VNGFGKAGPGHALTLRSKGQKSDPNPNIGRTDPVSRYFIA